MIKKKGRIALELLLVLVVIVVTSAVVLWLVKGGVIEVEETSEEVDILNTNFIPYVGGEEKLVIGDFKFCGYVDEGYNCVDEKDEFLLGSKVYFRFVVESSVIGGEVLLVENYRVKGPGGEVLLEVDDSRDFYFDGVSVEKEEEITFKDYFTVGIDMPLGEYTLELVVENIGLGKKVKLVKGFVVEEVGEFNEKEIYE